MEGQGENQPENQAENQAIEQMEDAKEQARKTSSSKYEIDMCNGPLLGKILIFYVPLMLSGILQLLFNAADIVVIGRFK